MVRFALWKGGGIRGREFSIRTGPLSIKELSLSRRAAGALNQALEDSGFFGLPAVLPSPELGPVDIDRIEYRLAVHDEQRSSDVRWDDRSEAPRPLMHLADLVASLDRWERVPWESWDEDEAVPS